MHTQYPVILSDAERADLQRLIAAGMAPTQQLTDARVPLIADQSPADPVLVDEVIADALEISRPTMSRIRTRYVEEGRSTALNCRAPRLEQTLKRGLLWVPLPARWHDHLGGWLQRFLLGMLALQHKGRALGFISLTAIIWLMDAVVAITVAQAFGLVLSLPQALLLLVALGLASAAPSTPGYVGIYQFFAVTVLLPFGIARNQALV
jgi:hypothetical protein